MSLSCRSPLLTVNPLIHHSLSSPSAYELVRRAIQFLSNKDDELANAAVLELLSQYPDIAQYLFFLVWVAAEKPTPSSNPDLAHPEFGKLAFFGQEGRSISREQKLEVLFLVEKASCALCSQANIDEQLVYSDGRYWNVLCPLTPGAIGHLLIIPQRHVDRFDQLTTDEAGELVKVTPKCAKAFQYLYQVTDYLMMPRDAGSLNHLLPHFHIHLAPVFPDPPVEMIESSSSDIGTIRRAFEQAICIPNEIESLEKILSLTSASEVDLQLMRIGVRWRLEALLARASPGSEYNKILHLLGPLKDTRIVTQSHFYTNLKEIDGQFSSTALPFCSGRDRHESCMPYRFNQVFSAGVGMNGSYIKFPEDGQSYCLARTFCISMAAPTLTYIPYTLRMYMEKGVKIVVNLTDFEEEGNVKADPYFPMETEKTESYGDYSITSKEISQFPLQDGWSLEQNKCTLHHRNKTHEIIQFHVRGWKDFTTGSLPAIISIIKIIAKQEKLLGEEAIVVHCSGGIGRTGIFITGKKVYELLQQGKDPDVRHIQATMRLQRRGLGGSEDQYKTVWGFKEECLHQGIDPL